MEALLDYQKSELIDGVVYNMSPASIKHIRIQRRLSIIIGNFLRGKRCEVFSEAEVRLDENNKFIPDLCIICTPSQVKTSYIEGAPDFVVEILSRSTRKKDLFIKLDKYRNAGVREFWVVDPDKRVVLVWHFEQDDYGIYGFRDMVPVRIYGGELKIDFSIIDDYITGWM